MDFLNQSTTNSTIQELRILFTMRVSAYLKLKLMANRLTYVSSKSGQMFRVEVWK